MSFLTAKEKNKNIFIFWFNQRQNVTKVLDSRMALFSVARNSLFKPFIFLLFIHQFTYYLFFENLYYIHSEELSFLWIYTLIIIKV